MADAENVKTYFSDRYEVFSVVKPSEEGKYKERKNQ
jgi:hypothetical protein